MRNLFSDNKKLTIVLSVVLTIIMVGTAVLGSLFSDNAYTNFVHYDNSGRAVMEETESGENPLNETAEEYSELTMPTVQEAEIQNYPSEMHAVYLTPGVDYATDGRTDDASLTEDVNTFFANCSSMAMNTVVVLLNNENGVVYSSPNYPRLSETTDILSTVCKLSREYGMYLYFKYDVLTTYNGVSMSTTEYYDASIIDKVTQELTVLCDYSPDGIFLDDYDNPLTDTSYSAYVKYGGGIGFESYMQMVSRSVITLCHDLIRNLAPEIQIGLVTGSQWAAQVEDEEGSKTFAAYSMKTDGNCDVKAFIEDGLCDMVCVEAFGSLSDGKIPFETVCQWWADLALKNDIRMYMLQASSRMSSSYTGWGAADQLTQQVIAARSIDGYCGSVFDSYARLMQDPGQGTTRLTKYYNDELDAKFILTELQITNPTSTEYSTYEKSVTFKGASDATMTLTLNGEAVTRDDSGYFSINKELAAGLNTFVFQHKDKTITYKITRIVKVIQEDSISPTGSLTVDGGTVLDLSLNAYEGSTVTATINGTVITLMESDEKTDDYDGESSYVRFTGTYTVPSATSSVQNLGSIVFKATYDDFSSTETGATIKVNKIVQVDDGSPIIITADQARAYAYNTTSVYPSNSVYALPKGTLDYAVSSFTASGTTYYKLACGIRVAASDLSTTSDKVKNVSITGITLDSKSNESYTYIKLPMSQNTSYTVSYSSSSISFAFNYVTSVPKSLTNISDYNALFSSASWSGTTLTLNLKKSGAFMGYKATYSNGQLVLRFNNPPQSISDLVIYVDPGHGGKDVGASGFLDAYPESVINLSIAQQVVSKLRSKGVTVIFNDTSTISSSAKFTIQQRLAQAKTQNPQIYLSIHCNASTNSSASGTETFYFYPWSQALASCVNTQVNSAMANTNRGVKQDCYYVTTSSQFASILTEIGFVSNQAEYQKLLNDTRQEKVAAGIVTGIVNYLSKMQTGSFTGKIISDGDTITEKLTNITLSPTTLTIAVGDTSAIKATCSPDGADQTLDWSSSNTNVATVDSAGNVTAVAEGSAIITASGKTEKDVKATCSVTVTKKVIPITSISIDQTAVNLYTGDTQTLKATVNPSDASDQTVTWSSSDIAVASVDANGVVTGVKAGTAVITASGTTQTDVCAKCTVTVQNQTIDATAIELSQSSLSMTSGKTETLQVTFTPLDATDQTVTWSSSDENIVKVDTAGKVTAVSTGSATITVTSNANNSLTATCSVTVQDVVISVTGISISESGVSLKVSQTKTITATIVPSNATDNQVTWSSSDASIASVDASGLITANSVGTVTITATSHENSAIYAECTVIVDVADSQP